MIRKCETAEDMRRLEAEVNYFYTHGGSVMGEDISCSNECAMTEADHIPSRSGNAVKKTTITPNVDTKWRSVVHGGLEAEIAYFYEHGGPIMN